MKRIVILIAALCATIGANAQYRPGHHPSYGPGYGPGYPNAPVYGPMYPALAQRFEVGVGLISIGDFSNVHRNSFPELYGEWRGYLNDWFDVGVQAFFTGGTQTGGSDFGTGKLFQTGWEGILDWNFFAMPNMAAFLGFGLGRTYGYYSNHADNISGWSRGWLIDPRVGLELFDRLRITAHLRGSFAEQIGAYAAISIGWMFSPRPYRRSGGPQPRDPSTMQPRIR